MARRLFFFSSCFGKVSLPSSSADHHHHHHQERNSSSENKATTAEFTAEEHKREGPVVLELFSSQGCATSTEAEMLLSRIGRGDFEDLQVPVILVAYHVDYWDYKGWKDPFGSSQWTVRQKAYVETLNLDTMFTPQIVLQGKSQCVGNEPDAVLSSIQEAIRFPAPALQATFERTSEESLQVSITGTLRTKVDHQGAYVMVALYQSGLVTDCKNGENGGKVLANDFVVRKLEKLCFVKDFSAKKTIAGTINFTLWDGFSSSKCGVAVFVQGVSHQIFGSQSFKLPENL